MTACGGGATRVVVPNTAATADLVSCPASVKFVGFDASGTGLIFSESAPDAEQGARFVALAVQSAAGTTRIPIPSDAVPPQLERGGVVIAPAR